MFRTFHFSSRDVGGFQVKVDLNTVDTVKEIEQICTARIIDLLLRNNLTEMFSKVENKKFHIHDLTIEEIKNESDTRMFYICDMCESQN